MAGSSDVLNVLSVLWRHFALAASGRTTSGGLYAKITKVN